MNTDQQASPLIDVTNINEKVYLLIKQNIIKFVYPPGHNLNITELKETLGVSPTPIKDALFKLAGEGLVVIYPRRGTYVKDITAEDIHEIIQTRLILETAVIGGGLGAVGGVGSQCRRRGAEDPRRQALSRRTGSPGSFCPCAGGDAG